MQKIMMKIPAGGKGWYANRHLNLPIPCIVKVCLLSRSLCHSSNVSPLSALTHLCLGTRSCPTWKMNS